MSRSGLVHPVAPLLIALALLPVALSGTHAQDKSLVTALSTETVDIGKSLFGANLAFFATYQAHAANGPGSTHSASPLDLIVLVQGPARAVYMREQRKIFGLWIGGEQRLLPELRGFQVLNSTRAPTAIANSEILSALGIPRPLVRPYLMEPIHLPAPSNPQANESEHLILRLRNAYDRIMREENRFRVSTEHIATPAPNVFQGGISLPASIETGMYSVQFLLFSKGRFITSSTRDFEVVRAGFEQLAFDVSRQYPLLYGLLALLLLQGIGFLAFVIFRKG